MTEPRDEPLGGQIPSPVGRPGLADAALATIDRLLSAVGLNWRLLRFHRVWRLEGRAAALLNTYTLRRDPANLDAALAVLQQAIVLTDPSSPAFPILPT